MLMAWAEETETNGAIVALDQEKAYDKIAHDYMWRVLRRFGIPENMIKVVQSLYANAYTQVTQIFLLSWVISRCPPVIIMGTHNYHALYMSTQGERETSTR